MSLERIKNINKKIVHFIIAIFLHLIVAQHIRYMVMELVYPSVINSTF
jgi:hypothetical protein